MLINLSKYPLELWNKKQRKKTEQQFGQVVDLNLPPILKEYDLNQVIELVDQYVEKCLAILSKSYSCSKNNSKISTEDAIHVIGEMTFVYQFVKKMSEQGVMCLAATSDMNINEYVPFRPYTTDLF